VKPRRLSLATSVLPLLLLIAAWPRAAGQDSATRPRFLNARVEEQPAGDSLGQAFATAAREHATGAWIAFSVRSAPGDHQLCDADRPQRIYLEGRPPRPAPSEPAGPASDIVVLARTEGGQIARLRLASIGCEIDAGGLPVVWLTGVQSAQSVDLLRQVVGGKLAGGVDAGAVRRETALMALALHGDAAAEPALEALAAPGQEETVRRRAVFWLSRSRDPRAIAFTEAILRK
jgi:hypothetical protein